MEITERDLENICIALMIYKDRDGRYDLKLGQLSADIVNEFKDTGRVCLDVKKE